MAPGVPSRLARLPAWAPLLALATSLALAWLNFVGTTRWAHVESSLHGWKQPWYLALLAAASLLAFVHRRSVGQRIDPGRVAPLLFLAIGASVLGVSLLVRFPLSSWTEIPFEDDWTPLFQVAVNGVRLLERGAIMGWNWPFLGGYPASTDVAQSFAAHAFVPMQLFGDRVGFHVLHAAWLLSIPLFVWWDVRQEDRTLGLVAGGLACFLVASISVTLGKSGDVNSLAGLFSAGLSLVGSRAARLGRRWGGPALLLGLTAGLYSHAAFVVYAAIFLALEAFYFRDRVAAGRLVVAGGFAFLAALPVHWESLRYPAYVSFNNVVFEPGRPVHWPTALRLLYYNVEILALPHRWFNDYRSLVNIWVPVVLLVALQRGRTRAGFYAWATLLTHALLRLNMGQLGAGFDRVMHMLPLVAAAPLAAFLLRFSGTRALAASLAATMALYVAVSFRPVRHVNSLREFNPPLMDRIIGLDGNLVLVEVSPHRDMDRDPVGRSPRPRWNVHFEGLLPTLAGQRFYTQIFDGWTWSIWRGQVLGAGAWNGRAIDRTPPERFRSEMRKWGVRHLLVWTDQSRRYLSAAGGFVERWRQAPWSHFELLEADVRPVVVAGAGEGRLERPDPLGGDVRLEGVRAGQRVTVRTNYYPAWTARAGDRQVPLHAVDGQLSFNAPMDGAYTVRLEYPARRGLSAFALVALVAGMFLLGAGSRHVTEATSSERAAQADRGS